VALIHTSSLENILSRLIPFEQLDHVILRAFEQVLFASDLEKVARGANGVQPAGPEAQDCQVVGIRRINPFHLSFTSFPWR